MVYVRVKEILKEKKKTKYWFVKKMEGGYQALSHLIDNETTGIHFDTLEKLCNVLECEPGDILVLNKISNLDMNNTTFQQAFNILLEIQNKLKNIK